MWIWLISSPSFAPLGGRAMVTLQALHHRVAALPCHAIPQCQASDALAVIDEHEVGES